MILSSIFLAGKTLKELNFPKNWEYDYLMFRWKNKKEYITIAKGGGRKTKIFLYITDEMLSKLNNKQNNNNL
jgi:hypothetical protein